MEPPLASGAWLPLRRPVYRALYLAQFVSNTGTWMQTIAAQWLMGDLAGGAFAVAIVQTATTLPIFLAVIPAGALGDLFDRRRLLLGAQGRDAGPRGAARDHHRSEPHHACAAARPHVRPRPRAGRGHPLVAGRSA